jgi:xanthine/uracil permease
VIGIDLLRRVDLREHGPMVTLAAGLSLGLLPILVPGLYSQFPHGVQMIMGNGLAAGTIIAVIVNAAFELGSSRRDGQGAPVPAARAEG